jgi:hypothetical protein
MSKKITKIITIRIICRLLFILPIREFVAKKINPNKFVAKKQKTINESPSA